MESFNDCTETLDRDCLRIEEAVQGLGCHLETVDALLLDASNREHNEHLARAARHLTERARELAGEIEHILMERRAALREAGNERS